MKRAGFRSRSSGNRPGRRLWELAEALAFPGLAREEELSAAQLLEGLEGWQAAPQGGISASFLFTTEAKAFRFVAKAIALLDEGRHPHHFSHAGPLLRLTLERPPRGFRPQHLGLALTLVQLAAEVEEA